MPFTCKTYRVLIASPTDLIKEREAASDAINDWNALYASAEQVVLLPIKWETHASPRSGVRPQEAINEQLVKDSDILVGMFWTKLGTKTGVADSGTVEEIDQFVAAKKPALLYFSNRPINPGKINLRQHRKLRKFQQETYEKALVGSFTSPGKLKQALVRDLLNEVRALKAKSPALGTEKSDVPLLQRRVEELTTRLAEAERKHAVQVEGLTRELDETRSRLRSTDQHMNDLGLELRNARRAASEAEIIRQHAAALSAKLSETELKLKGATSEKAIADNITADQWRQVESQIESLAKGPLGPESVEALYVLARDGQANDGYVLGELRKKGMAQGSIMGIYEGLSGRTNLVSLGAGQGDRSIRADMKKWVINPELRKLVLHYFERRDGSNPDHKPDGAVHRRLKEALADNRYLWRSLKAVAGVAAISEELAAELLRSDNTVRFRRGQDGVMVALRSRVDG
jgi:hypothetical protein